MTLWWNCDTQRCLHAKLNLSEGKFSFDLRIQNFLHLLKMLFDYISSKIIYIVNFSFFTVRISTYLEDISNMCFEMFAKHFTLSFVTYLLCSAALNCKITETTFCRVRTQKKSSLWEILWSIIYNMINEKVLTYTTYPHKIFKLVQLLITWDWFIMKFKISPETCSIFSYNPWRFLQKVKSWNESKETKVSSHHFFERFFGRK